MAKRILATWLLTLIPVVATWRTSSAGQTRASSQKADLPYRLEGVATRRIEAQGGRIAVFVSGKTVNLGDFRELLVAAPVKGSTGLTSLVGKSIALVPTQGREREWNIYADARWMDRAVPIQRSRIVSGASLTLPDNILIVKRVFKCSSPSSIRVQEGRLTYRLKPGEVLIVLT